MAPPYLFQWENQLGHLVLSYILGNNFIGVVTLASTGLHDFGDNAFHFLLLSNLSKEFVIENLGFLKKKDIKRNKESIRARNDSARAILRDTNGPLAIA